jgi:hypothetical protein
LSYTLTSRKRSKKELFCFEDALKMRRCGGFDHQECSEKYPLGVYPGLGWINTSNVYGSGEAFIKTYERSGGFRELCGEARGAGGGGDY